MPKPRMTHARITFACESEEELAKIIGWLQLHPRRGKPEVQRVETRHEPDASPCAVFQRRCALSGCGENACTHVPIPYWRTLDE